MPSTLQSGDNGLLVKDLQQLLCNFGYLAPHAVDGDFGPGTAAAVERFQDDYNLTPVDGIVGPTTWSNLEHYTSQMFGAEFFLVHSNGAPAEEPDPESGTTGEPITIQDLVGELRASSRPTLYRNGPEDYYSIALLAEALAAAGYPADDTWSETISEALGQPKVRAFDRSLHDAAKRFQGAYGLTQDGIVGPLTWATLVWALCGGEDDAAQTSYAQPDDDAYPDDAVERRSIVLSQNDLEFERWLRGYGRYLEGDVSEWEDPANIRLWEWADTQPEILDALEALREEARDNQLGIWADGRIETNAQHRQRVRRERFLKGLGVMTSGPFGGATYHAAKALGADEDAALSAGEMANTAMSLVGDHAGASTPNPRSTDGDPGYGQYPQ